jgi:ferredoxin
MERKSLIRGVPSFFRMIVTKQKEFEALLDSLKKGPVFIAGCSECATLCHTGGKDEILAMKKALEKKNIPVSGWVVLEPACHLQNDKRLLKPHRDELRKAKKVLVLACGNGAQTLSEILKDTDIVSGTDSLFVGEIKRADEFEKRCVMCGTCILDLFIGICPVSRCPKAMLNGPCGGSKGGTCEVDPNVECVWDTIYKRLKEKGQLHLLETIQKPLDWSKSTEMRRST